MFSICGNSGLECIKPVLCAFQLLKNYVHIIFCLFFQKWLNFATLNLFLVKVKDHNIKLSFQDPIRPYIYSQEASVSQATFVFPTEERVNRTVTQVQMLGERGIGDQIDRKIRTNLVQEQISGQAVTVEGLRKIVDKNCSRETESTVKGVFVTNGCKTKSWLCHLLAL